MRQRAVRLRGVVRGLLDARSDIGEQTAALIGVVTGGCAVVGFEHVAGRCCFADGPLGVVPQGEGDLT